MTQVIYDTFDSFLLPIAGISGVSGTIDAGSNHGNQKVPFTIPDADLATFFGADDGNIHITQPSPDDGSSTIADSGLTAGLIVSDGSIVEDDFNWAGSPVASTASEPTITINYTSGGGGGSLLPLILNGGMTGGMQRS